ncbi:MAG: nickel ABC transporter permease [Candidatus Binatota bacterium]|jgi:peptide/nickel transport system permease protein|nr:MAG: glutathione ABC transporter permease GsiC [Deltaproteobacteria bacterium GWD2_55_8]OGQ68148.1 MAG: glutathione ABC transporter permease GsiC [Deltaproteobacteria bacterium RIFCSPLOWO2_12_55_13]OGQ94731.1 MAG: glutathione ABC transporter permease GsiC [Deltaproteobacteria bacterium RIFOXYA2_FULL_55_11]
MKRYFTNRLLLFVPTLMGSLTLVFFLIHFIPGDPVEVMLGETASSVDKEALRQELGLNQPLGIQYIRFFSALLQGDLGRSLYEQGTVAELILSRFPATMELTLAAMGIALFVAFPLGILAAVKKNSLMDRIALLFSLLGLAMPNFWLGPLLMIIFSIELGWLPVSGREGLAHLILPSFTLGMLMASILIRMVRSSLLETIHEDYIQTARAKGLSEWRVWLKHALGNSLLSVITIVGLQFGALLAGSIITETIFAWPGIGRLTIQAIQTRDYPLVQGCVLVISTSYLVVNFLTDILYHLADPRVSYGP